MQYSDKILTLEESNTLAISALAQSLKKSGKEITSRHDRACGAVSSDRHYRGHFSVGETDGKRQVRPERRKGRAPFAR